MCRRGGIKYYFYGGKISWHVVTAKKNESIKCTVTQCANHCDSADYCSLSSIQVGTHEANPTMVECTDCNSFELKK